MYKNREKKMQSKGVYAKKETFWKYSNPDFKLMIRVCFKARKCHSLLNNETSTLEKL